MFAVLDVRAFRSTNPCGRWRMSRQSRKSAWTSRRRFGRFSRRTCFKCHGPDEGKLAERALRLDRRSRTAWVSMAKRGVVIPGNPEGSELLQRIIAEDPDDLMPPSESGHRLDVPRQIETRSSMDSCEGAVWEEHWAFIPPDRHPVAIPSRLDAMVQGRPGRSHSIRRIRSDQTDQTDPIDQLIQARGRIRRPGFFAPRQIARCFSGESPSISPAFHRSLREMDAFVADESPAAYETVVDRLAGVVRLSASEWRRHGWTSLVSRIPTATRATLIGDVGLSRLGHQGFQ